MTPSRISDTSGQRTPETLHGLSISPGLATGRAFVYRDTLEEDVDAYAIDSAGVDDEFARVEEAKKEVLADLDDTARRLESDLDKDHADIFRAQAVMLRSPIERIGSQGCWGLASGL